MSQPFNRILLLDFETRYATKPQDWCPLGDDLQRTAYTLSKMTNEEYVRAKCFKAFGASMRWFAKDAPVTQWYSHAEIERVFSTVDWNTTGVVAHNAQFDVSVLSWRYGRQPAFIFDTLSMARALRGVKGKNSLAAIAEDFGLPAKGGAIALSDGVQDLEDVPGLERKLAEYCNHDVFLLEEIFKRFLLGCANREDLLRADEHGAEWDFDAAYDQRNWWFPKKELRLIDMTLRMYTRPLLELDQDMLTDALEEEREAREGLLSRMGVTDGDLASNDRFAEILRSLGVEPPTKKKRPTAKTPNPVGFNYAFAKNDAMFQALLNGDDENVSLLCEARLKVKSTTERTRAQRFLDISARGPLPVPLSYFGAGTGRWTAAKGSAINMQNLKRGSFLRRAIMAPKGYKLVVGDLSQIEPRVLAWLADYDELLDIFRAKKDPYSMFGSQMFNIEGLTKEAHPDLRQSAKSAMLGCGYQLGWAAFAGQLLVGFLGAPPVRYDKAFAKKLGVDKTYIERFLDWDDNVKKMMEIPHTCTTQELLIHCVAAKRIIDIYRATAAPVVGLWELFQQLIPRSLADGEEYVHKCLIFRKEEIVLPNGMSMKYPNLRQQKNPDTKKMEWVYGEEATRLYAGKIANNVTQGTARIVMTDGMLRVSQRYPVVGTVHDEQIDVAPEAEAEEALSWVLSQMTLEPKYMPGIPLAADGGVHRRYGLAKN
jgi:hypothetical protein